MLKIATIFGIQFAFVTNLAILYTPFCDWNKNEMQGDWGIKFSRLR